MNRFIMFIILDDNPLGGSEDMYALSDDFQLLFSLVYRPVTADRDNRGSFLIRKFDSPYITYVNKPAKRIDLESGRAYIFDTWHAKIVYLWIAQEVGNPVVKKE